MNVNQLIARLQELSAAGHGDSEVFVGYNTGGPGSDDGESCFVQIGQAGPDPHTLPRGIWLSEAEAADNEREDDEG